MHRIALMLILCCGCGRTDPEAARNAVRDDRSMSLDFGLLEPGQTVSGVIPFQNTTGVPLTFLDRTVSCGCLSAGMIDEPVEPQGEVQIPVKLAASRKPGPMTQTVTFETNVAEFRYLKFTVTGLVKGEWSLPSSVRANREFVSVRQPLFVDVYFATDKPVEIQSAESDDARLAVTVLDTVPKKVIWRGQRWKESGLYQSRLRIDYQGGQSSVERCHVLVRSTNDEMALLSIPVFLPLGDGVSVSPARIIFDTGERLEKRVRTVRIDMPLANETADELEIVSDSVFVKCEVAERTENALIVEARLVEDCATDSRIVQGTIEGRMKDAVLFRVPYTIVMAPE